MVGWCCAASAPLPLYGLQASGVSSDATEIRFVSSALLPYDTFIVGSAIINPQSYHFRNQNSEQEEWTSIGFALQTNRWGVGGNSVQCLVRPFVRFGHSSISESTSASGMSSIFMGRMCCRGTFILVLPRPVVVCIRSVI